MERRVQSLETKAKVHYNTSLINTLSHSYPRTTYSTSTFCVRDPHVVLVLNGNVDILAISRDGKVVTYPPNAFTWSSLVAREDCEGVDVVVSWVEGRRTFVAQTAWKQEILYKICILWEENQSLFRIHWRWNGINEYFYDCVHYLSIHFLTRSLALLA